MKYNVYLSFSEGTIRFVNNGKKKTKRTENEALVYQAQDTEEAKDVSNLIKLLRPDLKVNEDEIEA